MSARTKRKNPAINPEDQGLSEDALLMWAELTESDIDTLDRVNDAEFRDAIAWGQRRWSKKRIAAALGELEAAGILDRTARTLEPPASEQGVTSYVAASGVLVQVKVTVFSEQEVDHPQVVVPDSYAFDEMARSFRKTGRPLIRPTRQSLYWCTTEDHDEDWFMVAPSAFLARSYFASHEGYGREDVQADWVAPVPDSAIEGENGDWPSDDLLRACGGEFLPYQPIGGPEEDRRRQLMGAVTKAVRFGSRTYVAGDIVANQPETAQRLRSKQN